MPSIVRAFSLKTSRTDLDAFARSVREAASRYATSTGDFDVGFERAVMTPGGVDPNSAPLGPPTQELSRWPGDGSPAAS